MADGVTYREEPCRSALNRVTGMRFGWSLNPYMGCAHRCTFCYVRAFERRADRQIGVAVAVEVARREGVAVELVVGEIAGAGAPPRALEPDLGEDGEEPEAAGQDRDAPGARMREERDRVEDLLVRHADGEVERFVPCEVADRERAAEAFEGAG